jgi:hypothetical protein
MKLVMKNFKQQYIVSSIIAVILSTSCNKVLDTTSELYVSDATAIVDKKSANAALVGAYSIFSANAYQGNTFRYVANLSGDNLKWVGNTPTNREFWVHDIFATNSRVSELWGGIYKTINLTNHIINEVPIINDVTYAQANRNSDRGEAFFIRAYSYFDLARIWGKVPIQTSPITSIGDVQPNVEVDKVFAQVEKDLDSAIALLPTFVNRNHASQYAAKALKARLYLYWENWAKAESNATDVINDAIDFKLVKPYNLFYASKNTTESVFEINYTVNNKNSWASNWFASNVTGGKRELLPTDDLIALLKDPTKGGDRSALLLTISGVTYGNMNFKIATGDDQAFAIRLAELYLIRAEARSKLMNISGGLSDLNTIRSRANIPTITSVIDGIDLFNKIQDERRLEFAFESHRWFDLIRTKTAQSVLVISDTYRLRFPIPKQEILSNSLLTQNAGYN